MLYRAGVDVGSTQTKAVIVDETGTMVAKVLVDTGSNVVKAAERAFVQAAEQAGLHREQVDYVVGTGYGRFNVTFGNDQITEISCHAKGIAHVNPNVRTVIDIGGQDAKAIKIDETGDVKDFVMNDKCAAGTGRFLGNSAEVLNLSLDEIGERSLQAKVPVRLSTVCTVFVETDILSHLALGRSVENILGGVHSAVAARVVALARRVGVEREVALTGGVSRNVGMVHALEKHLEVPIYVSPDAHFMGALGAALFANERAIAVVG